MILLRFRTGPAIQRPGRRNAFSMDIRLKRTPAIYLVGFMGTGKTTLGRALALHLGWHFVDLDEEIEREQNTSIAAIFDGRGEKEFRRLEREAIAHWVERIERGIPTVIALGGGAFVQPENFEMLENNGICIWLDCPFEIIAERIPADDVRPLARDPQALRKLYEERRERYNKADFRIASDCDPDAAVSAIMALPIWR